MDKNLDYKYLIGQYIIKIKEDDNYVYFITKENYVIRIDKFIPYCACYVGEYVDEITQDGTCFGTITNIKENIKGNQTDWYDESNNIVYKGEVTFYFENGKINMTVCGMDNGYYGVSFTMPVEIYKGDSDENNRRN